MQKIFSLYNTLKVHKIVYESKHSVATAECEIIQGGRPVLTSILISHTDLNRILAKLVATGYNLDNPVFQCIQMEDGSEIMDCSFDELIGEPALLENFEFTGHVTEIRA